MGTIFQREEKPESLFDKILKNRTIEYKQDDSLGALRSEGGIG